MTKQNKSIKEAKVPIQFSSVNFQVSGITINRCKNTRYLLHFHSCSCHMIFLELNKKREVAGPLYKIYCNKSMEPIGRTSICWTGREVSIFHVSDMPQDREVQTLTVLYSKNVSWHLFLLFFIQFFSHSFLTKNIMIIYLFPYVHVFRNKN